MVTDEKQYWVGFNLVKGIGAIRLRALLDHFGDIQSAWNAPIHALEQAGLSPKIIKTLQDIRTSDVLQRTWETICSKGITVITWEDPEYPHRLKEIDQPPPVLYVRGTLQEEDRWAVAMVGTRRMTSYGRQVTEEIAETLSRYGVTIISGLARGIDSTAHLAALKAKGRTIAVLGSGVDRIYPPEHAHLADQIIANGALISDYPPGTAPDAANFPPRNRIISGLARAVVIVEASEKSGALITAAFAAEQGREVFAVPGNIFAPQSKGTNLLIQRGAHILLNAQDLLETLNLVQVADYRFSRTVLPADANEAKLYSILGYEPLHVDEIGARSNLPIEQVSATLAIMELKGMARHVGGMRYIAISETSSFYLTEDGE